ncbi:MAG: hypothetical protein RLZZ563_1562 [Pseudomonadota bacterium]|jgi:hypothetical protein
MKAPLSCLTCRMIRRFLMAFAIGGMLTWQLTGTLPSDPGAMGVWQPVAMVAAIFAIAVVLMRMRQIRQTWHR